MDDFPQKLKNLYWLDALLNNSNFSSLKTSLSVLNLIISKNFGPSTMANLLEEKTSRHLDR